MDNGSDSDGTAFLLTRPPAKKRVVYFTKSDSEMESEMESNEDGKLGHDPAPALTQRLRTSKSRWLYSTSDGGVPCPSTSDGIEGGVPCTSPLDYIYYLDEDHTDEELGVF